MKLRADRRQERQQEATQRNAIWAELPLESKLESLRSRRGASTKQVNRLNPPKN